MDANGIVVRPPPGGGIEELDWEATEELDSPYHCSRPRGKVGPGEKIELLVLGLFQNIIH